jgi:hypothetical protein
MISVKHSGSFKNLERFLNKNVYMNIDHYLQMYGQKGVEALANATPRDTGLTANSWRYEITKDNKNQTITIQWLNDNVIDEWFNVALMLQYGHATGSGAWVEGVDYINPALRSIFDSMAEEIWKEVNSA